LKTHILTALAISTLTACGGSSSSSSGTTTITNTAPTVNAGSDQSVFEGDTVQLAATFSDAQGDTVTLSWSQTSGTSVTLSSTTEDDPTFTAPDVSADETLTFQVVASDGTLSSSDEVSISVADGSVQDIIDLFEPTSLMGTPTVVSCTLSGGSSSSCLSITLASSPGNYTVGPWCPRNIIDTDLDGGIWLENDQVYNVDGSFIQNLSTFYNDSNWQMFNQSTGAINYTETAEECAAAARPDVDPSLQNHCVECLISFLDDGLSATYLIPLSPETSTTSSDTRGGIGVAYSGIRIDGSAPVDAILGAYTLAPFDDCGGHVNPAVGYHIHAITDDCLKEVSTDDAHAAEIGLALDGYSIHERLNPNGFEPTDLDSCRGHTTDGIGYHYHVAEPGTNEILPCLSGQTAN